MRRTAESRAIVHVQSALRRALIGRRGAAIAAVSGGLDSLVMLHALREIRHRLTLDLVVATFDHGLRGADSAADAAWIEAVASEWGFACVRGAAPPGEPLLTVGVGVEAAARRARYAFLAETAHARGAEWVLLAHHADDQAETVLAHLVRGAGLHGLGAMRSDSPLPGAPDVRALRPLLGVLRAEIAAYARAHDLHPRHDVTNDDTAYTRNHLRHVVLPALAQINPLVVPSLARFAHHAARDAAYLDSLLDAAIAEGDLLWFDGRRAALGRERMRALPDALAIRAVLRAAAHIAPPAADLLPITAERAETVLSAVRAAQPGTLVQIGHGGVVHIRHTVAWLETG